jgi:acyl-phosphate glycerol 3-phosphate acyltransferase
MDVVFLLFGILGAYLFGAVPFGLLVARIKGVDLLRQGSGNIGATNVGRVMGRRYGLLVFLLDLLKGAISSWVGLRFLSNPFGSETSGILMGASAFVGHLFPIYLGFKGGKGVATGAGVMAVLVPTPFLFAILTWLAAVASTRMVSFGSLVSTLVLVVLQGSVLFLYSGRAGNWELFFFTLLCGGFVWIKHISNIKRICNGTENLVQDSLLWRGLEKSMLQLALGLWIGSYAFFTFVVGPGVFNWFEKAVFQDNPPYWLAAPEVLKQKAPEGLPEPLLKEQASRLAGLVVSPLFKIYYPLQVACASLLLILLIGKKGSFGSLWAVDKTIVIFVFSLALVVANWLLLGPTEKARLQRAKSTDAYILAPQENKPDVTGVIEDRKAFGKLHGISLIMNLGTGIFLLAGIICSSIHNDRKPEIFDKK